MTLINYALNESAQWQHNLISILMLTSSLSFCPDSGRIGHCLTSELYNEIEISHFDAETNETAATECGLLQSRKDSTDKSAVTGTVRSPANRPNNRVDLFIYLFTTAMASAELSSKMGRRVCSLPIKAVESGDRGRSANGD